MKRLISAVLSGLFMLAAGCGEATKAIPLFGQPRGGSGSLSSATTGWQGPAVVDASVNGMSNLVKNNGTVNTTPLCMDASGGFTTSGCVQQPAAIYSGGRWFVGFPQKLTTAAFAAVYEDYNILSLVSTLGTYAFGGFGTGTGYLNTFSGTTDVARYVQYASLSSGKVVGIYLIGSATTNEIYGNVWDPLTGAWGNMIQLSTGSGVNTDTVDIAFENYASTTGATDPDIGRVGNYCRPRVAASGNRAMVTWCERRAVDDSAASVNASYLRYAIYSGSSWLQEAGRNSSALLAAAGSASNGMNEDSGGTTADLRTTYHPGMARRVAVPAFVPNALFISNNGGADAMRIAYPIPSSTTGLVNLPFNYDTNPSQSQYLNSAAIVNGAYGVSSDGSKLFIADPVGNEIEVFNSIPTAQTAASSFAMTGFNSPRGVFSNGTRLFVSNSGAQEVRIWNFIPIASVSAATANVVLGNTVVNTPEQISATSTKLIVADSGSNRVRIWNTIPNANNMPSTLSITGCVSGPLAAYTDGKRLFMSCNNGTNEMIYIFNSIPSSGAWSISNADVAITHPGANPVVNIVSDGLRMFVSDDDSVVYVWRQIPFENRPNDYTITGLTNARGLAWSRLLPAGWPVVASPPQHLYSVNPNQPVAAGQTKNDSLTFTYRGSSVTVNNLIGDPLGFNRCTAIGNIVNQLNNNQSFLSLGLKAELPDSWGDPSCEDSLRGVGQYFYIVQNASFSPQDGVDNDATSQLTAFGTAGPENIRVVVGGDGTAEQEIYRFFYQDTSASASTAIEACVPTDANNAGQYFVGRMGDAPTAASRWNGYPVLPANGLASNPDAGGTADASDNRPVDLSATSFVDVAGSGNGRFQIVAAHRAWAQPYYNLTCQGTNSRTGAWTTGCHGAGWASNPTQPTTLPAIPSELAYPRTIFGYRFNGTDWIRLHSAGSAIPKPWHLGPLQPYAVDSLTQTVQPIPLGARWPRMVSSGSGKGLVFFYARNGQRPYNAIASSQYGASGTYDQASEVSVANALWMATYDEATGFSTASVISPDTAADKLSSSSLATDLDVCETGAPFAGTAPGATIGTVANACQVGEDPYLANAFVLTDTYGYTHDVAPIAAAMNSSGQAVVGMHRRDTNTTQQYIGFYVAHYGPQTGLGSFTRVDSGKGFTLGGAVAIDASGNVAAVWEERSLVTRTSAQRASCADTTTLSQAENHVYYRYYNAALGSWGSITQVDSSDIYCYGNTNYLYSPEAPMMPNVAFGDRGRILVTYSGPACNTPGSTSCRRRQFINQYVP